MLFHELLLIALGARDSLSRVPTRVEWEALYQESDKQTILGVMLEGLERLPNNQRPPQDILLQWIGIVQTIEQNSLRLKKASDEAVHFFRNSGFACILLKGASVARYYSNPVRRQSGDVDVWLNGGRKKIYQFARKNDDKGLLYGVNYHHIHFHLIKDVHLEAHIWPSYLCSPLRNIRFHKFCSFFKPTMEGTMPSLAFDRVFILLHCYKHICGDGVGFRQIMDYYYVLKQGFNEEERKSSVYWIKALGMKRFAMGIMWVLKFYLGLEDQFLLIATDKKEGKFILQEILHTGNFGHGDTRDWGSKRSALSRFLFNLRRDLYLAKHYPHEAIWQPLFSLWLYLWRLGKGLLKDRVNVEKD